MVLPSRGLGFHYLLCCSAPLYVDSDQLLPTEPHRVGHHDGHLQLHTLLHLHEGQVDIMYTDSRASPGQDSVTALVMYNTSPDI